MTSRRLRSLRSDEFPARRARLGTLVTRQPDAHVRPARKAYS